MKTILCYGDSNTWGYVPQSTKDAWARTERYTRAERWTGRLQTLLGNGYYVIEEGLNGRTTNLDYPFPPDRNGKTYLAPCLYSHAPIDLVILSLGGNDLKTYFKRPAVDIGAGLSELIDMIKSSHYGPGMQASPKILILSQPIPLSISENFIDEEGIAVFAGAVEKAKVLVDIYANIAEKEKCYFLDISAHIKPSEVDGMHFNKHGHEKLASFIKEKMDQIFYGK